MKERFFGLDIETSGTDVEKHAMIQVGVYDPLTDELFVSKVHPTRNPTWLWNKQAESIHRITLDQVLAAPEDFKVDARLDKWLADRGLGLNAEGKFVRGIPVGFNVSNFDMPFVRKFLPLTALRWSYRSVDLNAVGFSICEAADWDPRDFKREMKGYATMHIRGPPRPHDAGWDAKMSYWVWREMVDLLGVGVGESESQKAARAVLKVARDALPTELLTPEAPERREPEEPL